MNMDAGDPPVRLLAAFFDNFPDQTPSSVLQAPERDMWGMAARRDSGRFTLVVPDLAGDVVMTLESARYGQTALNRPLPGWARFAAGVVVALADAGLVLPGADFAVAGEEPAGPRYDYSLALVVAALVYELTSCPYSADQLAEVVERVRRDVRPA